MLVRIGVYLIDIVATFFVVSLLLRFHFQWLRVPFRNPVGQFVLATTNWMVVPARRVVPGLAGLDLGTLSGDFVLGGLFSGLVVLESLDALHHLELDLFQVELPLVQARQLGFEPCDVLQRRGRIHPFRVPGDPGLNDRDIRFGPRQFGAGVLQGSGDDGQPAVDLA